MGMSLLMRRRALRRGYELITKSLKVITQARKGRSIGGDVCLGVEECDELTKDLKEAEAAINELLERAGG